MLQGPTLQQTGQAAAGNYIMLEDTVGSAPETCAALISNFNHASTSPREDLPLEVPFMLNGDKALVHQCGIAGFFKCVKIVDSNNAVATPCGANDTGAQITDPPVMQPIQTPVTPPAPANSPAGAPAAPGAAPGQDPNVILLQGVLAVINMMTQVNAQLDQGNTHITQQQMQLQATMLCSNAHQLAHLSDHMSNIGMEVGKAIVSNLTRSTMHATLSQQSAISGQSNDPTKLGSLARKHPVGLSVPGFNYGPHVQLFQPQPNDKNMRRIDEATHQITQRHLPPAVQR